MFRILVFVAALVVAFVGIVVSTQSGNTTLLFLWTIGAVVGFVQLLIQLHKLHDKWARRKLLEQLKKEMNIDE